MRDIIVADLPYRRGHAEEVDQQEDHSAGHGSRGAVPDHAALAGDLFVTHNDPHQIANADHEIARW